jgi:hypothetical protein
MESEQMTKALAPFIKLVQANSKDAKALAAAQVEIRNTKLKLKKALEQRDEWRYQAQKYRKALTERV